MWEQLEIAGKKSFLRQQGTGGPVFLWATFSHDGKELENMEACLKETLPSSDFALIAYYVGDWNADLSPWEAPMAMGDGRFSGKGPDTLRWVTGTLLPWLKERYPECSAYYPMGYSLAGLFSLWSLYETDCFAGAVCCSGSLWIDGWDTYAQEHPVNSDAEVYLSLGGKEEKTRNPWMAQVGDRTRTQEKLLRQDPKVRRWILEWNSGGHFADSSGRLVKGIAWILKKDCKK